MNDFLLKYHLVKSAELKVKNLHEIYKHLAFFRAVALSEDKFIRMY